MKKTIVVLLALIALSSIFIFSGCQHKHRGWSHGNDGGKMIEKIAKEIDLNKIQKEQLNLFHNELFAKKNEMQESRAAIRDIFLAELKSDNFNEERVRGIIENEKAKLDEIINLFVTRVSEFHSTLTPEQKVKLVDKIEKMKDHKHE